MSNAENPDIERWIDLHEHELQDLAERAGAHTDTVHFLTMLVLAGSTDAEIYEQLRELLPSTDGRHSPLVRTPELLDKVRQLVEAS